MSPRTPWLVAASSLLAACVSRPDPRSPEVMQYDGAQLFATYCASCHGAGGQGNRALATSMVDFSVPDLTLIAYRAGGSFPREAVREIIAGTSPRPDHKSRRMPAWAWQFSGTRDDTATAEQSRAAILIGRLVDHLESLQRSPGE